MQLERPKLYLLGVHVLVEREMSSGYEKTMAGTIAGQYLLLVSTRRVRL